MKRIISIILLLAVLISTNSAAVSASYSGSPRGKQWVIKPQFDQALRFKNGFARVRKDDKWGYIDKTGKLVIPCQFEYADDFYDGIAFVGNSSAGDGKSGVIDTTGKLIIPYKYDRYQYMNGYIRATEDKLYTTVMENGKYGYVTSDGEILKCIYDELGGISEDRILIKKNGLYGFADLAGNEIVPCQYYYAYEYVNGYAVVEKLENTVVRAGVIDKAGRIVIPFDYKTVTDFREGNFYAVTPYDNQLKLLNTQGQIVDSIDHYYHARIMPYYRNIAMLYSYDGTSEVFDMKGKQITNLSPESIDVACDSNDSNQIMSIEKDDKYGFADGNGKLITNMKYSWISDNFYFRERNGIIRVATADEGQGLKMKNGKFGFINKEGKEVVPCKYGFACFYGFNNGVARVADGGSFTDPNDQQYGFSEEMNGHLTDLYTGGKWGYVDDSGTEIVPLKYDKVEPFVNYMGRVRLGAKYGFVNQQGEEIIPCIYDYVSYFNNGLALVGGQFVDQWGKPVELPNFDAVDSDTAEGLICAELDRKYGYFKNPLPAAEPVKGSIIQGKTSSTKYLTLSCDTPEADIYYSYEGGSMHSLASPALPNREDLLYAKYKEPILIDRLTTVRVYSVKKGMQNSEVQSFTIDVKYETLPGVQSSLPSGGYAKGGKVVLTSDKKDATIYYTIDGTIPNYKSPVYTGPIELKQAVTIKAFAVYQGMLDSQVNTFTYTIK